jgi:hypothetical protein
LLHPCYYVLLSEKIEPKQIDVVGIYAKAEVMDFKPKSDEFYGAITCRHFQKIDKALPGKDIAKIYNALNDTAITILAQLRTNI